MVRMLLALFASVAALTALPAQAANLGWLRGAIIEKYDDRDRSILGTELLSAVEFQPDGVRVTWWNARSGNWGTITPLERSTIEGAECRRVRIENRLGERRGVTVLTLCRRPGEDWMLARMD
jgi:surface antigen